MKIDHATLGNQILAVLTDLFSEIFSHWGDHSVAEIKPDGSYVTSVDRLVENRLCQLFRQITPDAYYLGEECHTKENGSELGLLRHDFVWIVDPIDGTREYVEGRPEFGTLVGLCRRDGDSLIPCFGLAYRPIIIQHPDETDLGRAYLTTGAGVQTIALRRDDTGALSRTVSSIKSSTQPQTPTRVVVHHKMKQKITVDGIRLPSAASVVDLLCPILGSADAAISKARIWDIAAPMALAAEVGLRCYNVITRVERSEIRLSDFIQTDPVRKWKLVEPIVLTDSASLSSIRIDEG